ncbi:MAG: prepilin peptidase [Planctomycetota bacterium]|nr:MAG: prepilin peptidase [Planctomycetota bacterium]
MPLMALFSPENWPLWVLSAAMIVCAVIDGWKLKVPNVLTFPLIVSGWGLGLAHNFGWLPGAGGIGASLAGTALGFALLLPVYAIGGMGAGDVKMQMGFGAWIGGFFGLGRGLQIIFYAFCAAAIIGGVIAVCMILIRGQLRRNAQNTREIVKDLFTAGTVGAVAGKAAERKPGMHLLPYGIPLCIGFVGYLFFLYGG